MNWSQDYKNTKQQYQQLNHNIKQCSDLQYCELKLWKDSRHHLYKYYRLTVLNDETIPENELDIMCKEMLMV